MIDLVRSSRDEAPETDGRLPAPARGDRPGPAGHAPRRRLAPHLARSSRCIGDGRLWLGMMPGSTKVADLRRDPRCCLHTRHRRQGRRRRRRQALGPTPCGVDDDAERAAYAAAFKATTGHDLEAMPGGFDLFWLDLTGGVVARARRRRRAPAHHDVDAGRARAVTERTLARRPARASGRQSTQQALVAAPSHTSTRASRQAVGQPPPDGRARRAGRRSPCDEHDRAARRRPSTSGDAGARTARAMSERQPGVAVAVDGGGQRPGQLVDEPGTDSDLGPGARAVQASSTSSRASVEGDRRRRARSIAVTSSTSSSSGRRRRRARRRRRRARAGRRRHLGIGERLERRHGAVGHDAARRGRAERRGRRRRPTARPPTTPPPGSARRRGRRAARRRRRRTARTSGAGCGSDQP